MVVGRRAVLNGIHLPLLSSPTHPRTHSHPPHLPRSNLVLGDSEQRHLTQQHNIHDNHNKPNNQADPGPLTQLAFMAHTHASHHTHSNSNSHGHSHHTASAPPHSTPSPPPPPLLLRFVDDYLFVAPTRCQAERLARRLCQGFPESGVAVNPAKTKANFHVQGAGGEGCGAWGQNLYVGADGARWVRWCGLMVNVRTLEVQVR